MTVFNFDHFLYDPLETVPEMRDLLKRICVTRYNNRLYAVTTDGARLHMEHMAGLEQGLYDMTSGKPTSKSLAVATKLQPAEEEATTYPKFLPLLEEMVPLDNPVELKMDELFLSMTTAKQMAAKNWRAVLYEYQEGEFLLAPERVWINGLCEYPAFNPRYIVALARAGLNYLVAQGKGGLCAPRMFQNESGSKWALVMPMWTPGGSR